MHGGLQVCVGALPACGVEARRTACAIEGADVDRVALPGGDEVGDLLAGVVVTGDESGRECAGGK
ncbi:hypothetical protein GCM10010496_32760 [Streptomyces asoensis]|nr:hypothetical protein GCM10010496_32760 [Streptomyces asoensis]